MHVSPVQLSFWPCKPVRYHSQCSNVRRCHSLKFKLFELGSGAGTALKAIASGVCERIGDPDGVSFLRVSGLRGQAGW